MNLVTLFTTLETIKVFYYGFCMTNVFEILSMILHYLKLNEFYFQGILEKICFLWLSHSSSSYINNVWITRWRGKFS